MVALKQDASVSETDITLRDGRVVHLRAILPTDENELLQAFARMPDEARYMRFMRSVGEPDLQRLRKALVSFPEGGSGIVATVAADDGTDIVASAVFFVGEKGATSCEFAITVQSTFGGVGLATALLTALIDAARKRSLRTIEGFVLATNQPMLRLAKRVGFKIGPYPSDPSLRVCRMDLTAR
jgi:RimJ/RimL family protein N-acetyltransferase